jgi:hypothetical protein
MRKKQSTNTDLYDVASLTKILSTLPNVMLQYDQQKYGNDLRLYAPVFKIQINKTYTLRILSHYARLQPWIPFYKATVDKKNPLDKYYKKESEAEFSTKWLTVFI